MSTTPPPPLTDGDIADIIKAATNSLALPHKSKHTRAVYSLTLRLALDLQQRRDAEGGITEWIKANSPGGWIDDLRVERDRMRALLQDLAPALSDEGANWSHDGLDRLRTRHDELTRERT